MRYKPFLKIGKRLIGEKYFPIVIVEIGINHNGKIKLAKELIKIAQSCGAEIIKHQTHIPDDEMSIEAKKIIPREDLKRFEKLKFLFEKNNEKNPKPKKKNIQSLNYLQVVVDLLWVWSKLVLAV